MPAHQPPALHARFFNRASADKWVLIATPFVLEEVLRNLIHLPASASASWAQLRPALVLMDDVLTIDRPSLFERAKDRPILFGALAWSDVLLTLDRADFGKLIDSAFYGLPILKPGTFLQQRRDAGQLR